MKLPIDVKAVLDEALSIDEARSTPVSVAVFIDESAPGDIQAHVRQAFASASPIARVSMVYFPTFPPTVPAGVDMAVVVAGLDEGVGALAANIRAAGVPVMVVTSLPSLVAQIAEAAGTPLLEGDLVTFAPGGARAAMRAARASAEAEADAALAAADREAAEDPAESEPYALDDQAARALDVRMGEWVVEACRPKRLAFALAFCFVRKPLALEAVRATAVQNAGVGLVAFIPGADLPIMTLNQAKMLLQIAAAYGEPMGIERARELVAVVGGAFACRSVARQVAGLVPGLGWVVKGGVGYAGTLAMGYAAIEYFEGGGRAERLVRKAACAVGRAAKKAARAGADLASALSSEVESDAKAQAGAHAGGSARNGKGARR